MEEVDGNRDKAFSPVGLAQLLGLDGLESRTTPFQGEEDDMTTPSPIQVAPSPTRTPPTATPYHVFKGPITRSQTKKLQQEVNAVLYEVQFNINENYIQPKSCTLLLLRFTKEYGKNIQGDDHREEPHSN